MAVGRDTYQAKVFELVMRIPKGFVMTYGQIARILGEGYTPRTVGHVMHTADTETVPWQRVINSKGACSTGRLTIPTNLQQSMLAAEGVVFDEKGCCNLMKYQWHPDEEGNQNGQGVLFADRTS